MGEQPIFGFQQNSWLLDIADPRINALLEMRNATERPSTQENLQIVCAQLTDFSLLALAGLTVVESQAFNSQMGESLVSAYEKGKAYTVFLATNENGTVGFLTLDEALAHEGIYYLDIAAVAERGKGIGKALHHSLLEYIRNQKTDSQHIIFARTQNPGEVLSFAHATHDIAKKSFPIDRLPTTQEQDAMQKLEDKGVMRKLSERQRLEPERAILWHAYESWTPKPFTSSGSFEEFLEREKIDFTSFIADGNTFIVGTTI